MQNISVMIKPASGNCNMTCDYCFYRDEQHNRSIENFGMMSKLTLENTIRRMVSHAENSCTIAFQGGEPTLAGLDFFEKAVLYANKYNAGGKRVHFALQTNGYNIDEDWCEFFKKNNFLVGVSVDGTRELHNKHRRSPSGNDTYDKILGTTKLMDKIGVDYNILTVVNGSNAPFAEKIYKSYQSHGWKWQQYIALIEPFKNPGNTPYSLSAEQYANFLTELFKCWYKDTLQKKQPYIRQFENYMGILMNNPPEACEQVGRCSIQYAVEADGSVYPCDFYMTDEYRLGNVNDTTVYKMDKKRDEIGFIKKSLPIPQQCMECEFMYLCRNGCQRNRNEDSYNKYCLAYKRFFTACLPKMKRLIETL